MENVTKGPWRFDGDWHRIPTIFGADGTKVATVEKDDFIPDGRFPSTGHSIRKPEREANARLIAEAGTVRHETGLSPRELAERVKELEAALRSVSAQCGNVIFNCKQFPAGNARHLSSWEDVKNFADAALANGGPSKS